MPAERVALYTTVYAGVERYLAPWYRSVQAQTDTDFDLWISVDGLAPDAVARAIGEVPAARWLEAAPGESPARLRTVALERLVTAYPAVVFVDSDDVMHPSRVAAARAALRDHDVTACALEIIDRNGSAVGAVFEPPDGAALDTLLVHHNVFGLSNSAYRSDLLRRCLPAPADCLLMDWLLVTRAWTAGASLGFDRTPRMSYRQYAGNVARVLPPFAPAYVLQATERVLNHYRCVLDPAWPLPQCHRETLGRAQDVARAFHAAITGSAATLTRYIEALNQLPPRYVWWWCVAHPELEDAWSN